MKVIILAAGVGSRLRPLTDRVPKGMVKVCGMPIIEHQILAYLRSGVLEEEIIIVSGYKSSVIEEFLSKKYPSVKLVSNKEYASTNNMYSLGIALDYIGDYIGDLVISNGDCVYQVDLVSEFIAEERSDLIACDVGVFIQESMKIQVDNELRVKKISKEIPEKCQFGVSIDLYKLSGESVIKFHDIVEKFLNKDQNSWTEVALQILFSEYSFEPFDIENKKWFEIDNHDDLIEAEKLFSRLDINKKSALVLDLDGTVHLGNSPIESAISYINNVSGKMEVYYVTNNTSVGRQAYVDKLKSYGIREVKLDSIVTPIIGLVKYIQETGKTGLYCMGTNNFKSDLESFGVSHKDFKDNHHGIDSVVITFDKELTYSKLAEVCALLHDPNIEYLATHSDFVCPTEDGPMPDIGSFIELIFIATGRRPDKYFGKPNPDMLQAVVERHSKDEVLFVGDRLYTDKILSENCGVDFCLVLSGETDLSCIQEEVNWPNVVLRDLGQMPVPCSLVK